MKIVRNILCAFTALILTGCSGTSTVLPSGASGATEPSGTSGASSMTGTTSVSSPKVTGTSPELYPETTESEPVEPTREAPPTVEPSDPVEIRALELLSGMTPEEKAGQVVLARYPGSSAAQDQAELHLGGFTLFAADIDGKSPEQLTGELSELQAEAAIPLLIAVDEEGGSVVRVSKFPQFRSERFPAQSEVLASGGADGVYADAVEKSGLLAPLGFILNLAPVCDLPRSASDYIYDRAFGTDVEEVCAAVRSAVSGYVDSGMLCALKHFPGYGNNLDTHTGISIDERPMSELEELDLKPFIAGIEAGAPVVMVSHNIVKCVNAELPGSLSPEMYTLVRSLGFDGVIMTDDLSMEAIGTYCGENRAAVTALLAGADLLCSSDYKTAVAALIQAVNSGEIPTERLDDAVLRILKMKIRNGMLD